MKNNKTNFLGFEAIINAAEKNARSKKTIVGSDGMRQCAVCGEPVECFIAAIGAVEPCICRCDRQADERKAATEAQEKARQCVKDSPLYSPAYKCHKFSADDMAGNKASQTCRRYAERFERARRGDENGRGYGLLLAGGVGTGKTFYAACIVNALLDKGVPALIFTASRLVAESRKNAGVVTDGLRGFPLVALDDVGAEKATPFSAEIIESFINSRYETGLPLIVTTNYSAAEIMKPSDIYNERLFSRLREMCAVVAIEGGDRRTERAKKRARQLKNILE